MPKYKVGMTIVVANVGPCGDDPGYKVDGKVITWDAETVCFIDNDGDVLFLTHDEVVKLNPNIEQL